MSTDKQYRFDDVATALKKIRKQHRKGKPLAWTGPDDLHSSVMATNFPPSWNFSEEGMEYHAEQGRGFWDVYTLVTFQIGYSNGAVSGDRSVEIYKQTADTYRSLFESAREALNEQSQSQQQHPRGS